MTHDRIKHANQQRESGPVNGGLEVNKNKPAKLERPNRVAKVTGAGHHVNSTNYSPTQAQRSEQLACQSHPNSKVLTDKVSSKAEQSQNAKMKQATINYTPDDYSHWKSQVGNKHVNECSTYLTKHTKLKQIWCFANRNALRVVVVV